MLEELLASQPAFFYISFALFSLLVGSLLNVVIYRLPLMLQAEWAKDCRELLHLPEQAESDINLFFPRSFCPKCKTQVKAWQNIPLVSYLFLKGKCSSCKQSISLRYPAIELLTMLLSLFALWHFGYSAQLPFVLLGIWLIICMFFIDLDHQLLPDSLTYCLLWLGLLANTQTLFIRLDVAVFSAVGAYLSLWTFIKLFYFLTGKVGMGHGDFKLFAAFGAWLGWTTLPLILFLSSLTGAIIGALYLKFNNQSRSTPIPFGPFLCVAWLVALFWGQNIMFWYLKL